jgi:hypothetical protein
LSREAFNPEKIIRSKWDEFISVNRELLVQAKLIGPNPGDFVNYSGVVRLLMGTVWQLHERISELEGRERGY